MSNEILKPLLETVKLPNGKPMYCCVKWWLVAHRKVRTGALADAWGLSVRTVRYWRRKMKLGEIKCECNANCRLGYEDEKAA